MQSLQKLTLSGYKSIHSLEDLELRRLNVLIGANGAGKSNFISFFELLRELIEGSLQLHVTQQGGADSLLHYGRRVTPKLEARLSFGSTGYSFTLVPTAGNRLVFASEPLPSINKLLKGWRVYHFPDTSEASDAMHTRAISDHLSLRLGAGNLAAFLFRLKAESPAVYEQIRDCVRLVMPSFGDFLLYSSPLDSGFIELAWREQGSDYPFQVHHLSGGILRFIYLAALLLQPELPSIILIDQPELGLHPYAIQMLASLLRSASAQAQLIIATQSVSLVDQLELEDLIVVERPSSASAFKRLQRVEFEHWLADYSLGGMWTKNVLGGRPIRPLLQKE